MTRSISQTLSVIIFAVATVAIPAACLAGGAGGCLIDGNTRWAWARTWHAPNALATPLTQYYIPRATGNCGSGTSYTSWGGGGGPYGSAPYLPEAAVGFEPVQFERLGKVPNELNLLGGAAMPVSAPAAAPRR